MLLNSGAGTSPSRVSRKSTRLTARNEKHIEGVGVGGQIHQQHTISFIFYSHISLVDMKNIPSPYPLPSPL